MPGTLGSAHGVRPHDVTPWRTPSQISGPPESPWKDRDRSKEGPGSWVLLDTVELTVGEEDRDSKRRLWPVGEGIQILGCQLLQVGVGVRGGTGPEAKSKRRNSPSYRTLPPPGATLPQGRLQSLPRQGVDVGTENLSSLLQPFASLQGGAVSPHKCLCLRPCLLHTACHLSPSLCGLWHTPH